MFIRLKNLKIFLLLLVFSCLFFALPAKIYTPNPLLKSALIPGWGQLSLNHSYGYAMLTAEILCWSDYYYATTEQDLKERSSYEYALKFAHINPGKYSSQYYRDLAKFNSSGFDAGGYNAMVRQEAINLFPADLAAQQQYIEEKGIPADKAWNWDSISNRNKYAAMRKDILELKDQAQIITGVLIANHIFSSIDMLRLKPQWKNVHASVRYHNSQPELNLSVNF
ncbi:MAG TPA: hypothetical protein PLF50_02040 [Candidatus Cloacimonadota bacterium]|nr:hypothetical protein [Candidatus Cloacimonadota bacterium]HOV16268.1 hypothetical protein [Candidatus Cloacimonadota bacterium]HQL14464.1 hypothetical protein [Candidatus Cloacimonadota bacterium]